MMYLGHWVVRRDLFGSDVILVMTVAAHLCMAVILLSTSDANWPIGVHAILLTFRHNSLAAALTLIVSCVLTAMGEWLNGNIRPCVRLLVLFPLQAALLLIGAIGVIAAIWTGTFPCATVQCLNPLPISRAGILVDQLPRLFWPCAYFAAVYARVRKP
jgi:hypothetical protein